MKSGILVAHTKNQLGERHYLTDHLLSVAEITSDFTKNYYCGRFMSIAWLTGILHDVGKANPLFQEYLLALESGEIARKVPHSPRGAEFVLFSYSGLPKSIRLLLCMPVAGHHAGLDEIGNLTAKISALEKDETILNVMSSTIQQIFIKRPMTTIKIPSLNPLQAELLIRMLFSALVDADRLDTEAHMNKAKSSIRKKSLTITELNARFQRKQEEFLEGIEKQASVVNIVRRQIYDKCIASAGEEPGLFRLTVPTGGGKTRSSLGFALKHAVVNGQERIVFALPYTSIIDQTANEYRKILGDDAVLEHHSQVVVKDNEEQQLSLQRLRLAEENWDVPLLVTTTVQLLESLFSNDPSRCRKIHRLANSIIIFDEAQTLPAELLKPTLQVLRDLIDNYGATVVLSTATQPALKAQYLQEFEGLNVKEIVPCFSSYYEQLKRVNYQLKQQPVTISDLAREVSQFQQALVIMNTRKRALELVRELDGNNQFHLSTLLCGAHRRQVLDEVRQRLDNADPILLISTQVVEAGVDLDFPVVYREMGPLDRIVQAAGRCNREGKMPRLGLVTIFELTEELSPRGPYKAGIEVAKLILYEKDSLEVLNNPTIYHDYFYRLYNALGNNLDAYEVQKKRASLDYPGTAKSYRLIREDTVSVVVRYGGYKRALDQWISYPSKYSWRKLHPYLVSIYRYEANSYLQNGLLTELMSGLFLWEGVYDNLEGLSGVLVDPADLII